MFKDSTVSDAKKLSVSSASRFSVKVIQGGPAKVRPTYIFDGNI